VEFVLGVVVVTGLMMFRRRRREARTFGRLESAIVPLMRPDDSPRWAREPAGRRKKRR
jgi:hypothetical protein